MTDVYDIFLNKIHVDKDEHMNLIMKDIVNFLYNDHIKIFNELSNNLISELINSNKEINKDEVNYLVSNIFKGYEIK